MKIKVTFIHEKYMMADSSRAVICSVNWDYTSFMENREAGVIIEGSGAAPVMSFLQSVFDYDFKAGIPWWTQQYSSSDLSVINNKKIDPVVIPPPRHYSDVYVTEYTTYNVKPDQVVVVTAPDDAYQVLFSSVNTTKTSFSLYIYQVTDNTFCEQLKDLYDLLSDDTFTLLVSNDIYDPGDKASAFDCYKSLYDYGITVRMTESDTYSYSHQKFWIVNNDKVWLSTGNWGDSDMPFGSNVFPPYLETDGKPNPNWRLTNRDFTIMFEDEDIVNAFQKVLTEDYKYGYDYKPY
jgi:hypothetical protein